MDYLTRQFSEVATKVRKELRTLADRLSILSFRIQEQTKALTKPSQSDRKHGDSGPMVRAELYIPDADKNEKKRAANEKKWLGRFQTLLEALTLAAVIWYATLAHRQWKEMGRAATAAEGANNEAHDALTRSARPWLGPEHFSLLTVPVVVGNSVSLTTEITVKNFGPSPALGVRVWFAPYTGPKIGTATAKQRNQDFVDASDKMCEIADTKTTSPPDEVGRMEIGDYIFPNQPTVYHTEGASDAPGFSESRFVELIGCISYGDQFGGQKLHHTKFCFIGPATKAGELNKCMINETAN
jgi:hypothetical protein